MRKSALDRAIKDACDLSSDIHGRYGDKNDAKIDGILRALRAAKKDRERLDWITRKCSLREFDPICSRRTLDAAIKHSRRGDKK